MLKRLLVLATLFLSATGASAAVLLSLDAAPTESARHLDLQLHSRLQAGAVLRARRQHLSAGGLFHPCMIFIGLQQPVGSGNFTAQTNARWAARSRSMSHRPIPAIHRRAFWCFRMMMLTIPNVTVTLTGPANIVPQGANVTLGTLTLTSTDGGLGALAVASEFLQNGTPLGILSSVDVLGSDSRCHPPMLSWVLARWASLRSHSARAIAVDRSS